MSTEIMIRLILPMNPPCLINDQLDILMYGAAHCKPLSPILITNAWNFAGLET
jgi:hypothetical protein